MLDWAARKVLSYVSEGAMRLPADFIFNQEITRETINNKETTEIHLSWSERRDGNEWKKAKPPQINTSDSARRRPISFILLPTCNTHTQNTRPHHHHQRAAPCINHAWQRLVPKRFFPLFSVCVCAWDGWRYCCCGSWRDEMASNTQGHFNLTESFERVNFEK